MQRKKRERIERKSTLMGHVLDILLAEDMTALEEMRTREYVNRMSIPRLLEELRLEDISRTRDQYNEGELAELLRIRA